MTSDLPATPPKVVWDLATPCKAIRDDLGKDALSRLHRKSLISDWVLFAATWAAFVGLWWWLSRIPFGAAWCAGAFLQAVIIFNAFYAMRHDLFFHRQIAGQRGSYAMGVACSFVLFQPYTEHTLHEDHHVHIGWDLSEELITDLDRRWKRWLCLTIVGILLLLARRFRPPGAPRPNQGVRPPPDWAARLKREKRLHLAFYVLLAAATWMWPWGVFKGYLLPVIGFGPFVLMARFILQHAETDPGNSFHAALYLRTGIFTRLLWYNAVGDGHLAHHFFPSIPLYRAGAAADLFHPILLKHGVQQRSLLGVLKAYFFDGREYRTRW